MRINGINASNSFPLFRGTLSLESEIFNEKSGPGLSFSWQGEKIKVVKIKDNLFEISLRHPQKSPRIYLAKIQFGKLEIKLYQKATRIAALIGTKNLPNSTSLNQQLQTIGKTVSAYANQPPLSQATREIYSRVVSQAKHISSLN